MATKYETLEVLKGAVRINIKDYLVQREKSLADVKVSWGNNQTATDEKFFKEKKADLDSFKNQLETLLIEMNIAGGDYYIRNGKVTLLVDTSEETA